MHVVEQSHAAMLLVHLSGEWRIMLARRNNRSTLPAVLCRSWRRS